ncbi:hypothetical protein [Eubacterium oxidoreducens]|uniref:Uncharacterized protein n=1 Tax=Eubacterium oxidoreducens TaxID=1732 RepID=A0A1G6C3Z7_EUBOX|nr:hypothetical protein [Eubacterium oxidoreducens]SDB27587.1 hypothetical protein SAMN02910417_02050 [Eubacterium oxidoreducens]
MANKKLAPMEQKIIDRFTDLFLWGRMLGSSNASDEAWDKYVAMIEEFADGMVDGKKVHSVYQTAVKKMALACAEMADSAEKMTLKKGA